MDPLKITFVDDNDNDHFIFSKTLAEVEIVTELTSVTNSEKLVDYLLHDPFHLPDIIFLDLNMPRKNGAECLNEIKCNETLNHIPVIIYSASYDKDMMDRLYELGAFYCMRKSAENKQTKNMITFALKCVSEDKNFQPAEEICR